MFRWLMGLLYGSTIAEFQSAYGIEESVERLKAATKRSVFSSLGDTAAVGKVTEQGVRLQRVIPMVGNSFKPFFIGRFEVRNGVTVLTGRFTQLMIVKVFMTVWFGLALVFAGLVLPGAMTPSGPVPAVFVFQPFLMIGFGIALLAAGKWFARNDAAWLSRVIEAALGVSANSDNAASSGVPSPFATDAVPMTLKVVSAFLVVSSVMAVVGPYLPAHGVPGHHGPSPLSSGNWNIVYAILAALVAMGVWRRQPWAWWSGFMLLALSFLGPFAAMRADLRQGPPISIEAVFAVFAILVAVVWGLWWYAQRKHFVWTRS